MFRWNFDHSTWGRFRACVVWILDSYATQPTCWFLPYRGAYSPGDTHHWYRKNTLTKTFGTQCPYLTVRRGGHENEPPIRLVATLVPTVSNDSYESLRLPIEHAAAASLSASWACSRSTSKASRCGELCEIICRTFNSPEKKLTFDIFFLPWPWPSSPPRTPGMGSSDSLNMWF